MTKQEYLKNPSVREFVKWIRPKLSVKNSFIHSYTDAKSKVIYNFDSIYDAYEKYKWQFSLLSPDSNLEVTGKSFDESTNQLRLLSIGLKGSINSKNKDSCKKYCKGILQWGLGSGNAYKNNCKYLDNNLINTTHVLKIWSEVLNLNDIDLSDKIIYKGIKINAGFTKIYSVIVNDFIIYDSRVGAALCMLVREFCKESNINDVPKELCFAWDNGKTDNPAHKFRRNPDKGNYKFPKLKNNNWIEMNVKASWLLKEILEGGNSKFRSLSDPLRSLEAALFMIGYQIN
jgi:hypothetical protein